MAFKPEVLEAGRELLAGLMAALPEDARAAIDPERLSEEALGFLGTSGLRQADYSRQTQELQRLTTEAQALYDRNKAWYDENIPVIEDFKATRAGHPANPANPNPNPNPANPTPHPTSADPAADRPITRKELGEILGQTERDFLGLQALTNDLQRSHFQRFGELLDTRALLADPDARKLGLEGVYQKIHGEKVKAKEDEAKATYEENLRKEGEQRVLARGDQISPIPGRAPQTETLMGLRREPPKDGEVSPSIVDNAIATYREAAKVQT